MWHCRQLGRYVSVCVCVCNSACMSQAFTCVSDMGKRRGWRIRTLVCESQRAFSLICNQNLVFLHFFVSLFAFLKNSNVGPRQHCLVDSKWTDSPAQKYTDYRRIDQELVQRDHARLRQKKSLWGQEGWAGPPVLAPVCGCLDTY